MHTTLVHVGIATAVGAEVEVLLTRLTTNDTPTWTDGQHRHPRQRLLEPRLLVDVPTHGECGEVTPALVATKLCATIAAD